jgi:glycosyltransferase involved in cell wall biosynthesis
MRLTVGSVHDVSVIIPTRNRALLARRATAIAASQVGVNVQVVVVDDGSNPPLGRGLIESEADGVKLVRNPAPGGLAQARNAGLAACSAEWVAFLDDDDFWAPDKLEKQLGTADEAGAVFVYASAISVDQNHRFLKFMPAPATRGLYETLLRKNVMPAGSSNVVVNRALLEHVGGFDEEFGHLADWDLWIRLAHEARPATCAETLTAYVEHPNALHVTQAGELWTDFAMMRAKHRAANAEPSEREFSRFVASAQYRAGRRRAASRTLLSSFRQHRAPGDLARAISVLAGDTATTTARRLGTRAADARVPRWVSVDDSAPMAHPR